MFHGAAVCRLSTLPSELQLMGSLALSGKGLEMTRLLLVAAVAAIVAIILHGNIVASIAAPALEG